jgi:NADH dehydrogenase FAD-containing subunit
MARVVVVGGGYAGLMAAFRAARERRAQVTLVDPKPAFVQRIRLHERLAGGRPETIAYAGLLARAGVRFVRGRVEALDLARRQAAVGATRLDYDHLVLALGSRTAPAVPGVAQHALTLDLPEGDADPLAEAARRWPVLAERGARVLVVGGGLSGLEAASELAERWPGLRVALVTRRAPGEGTLTATALRSLRRRLAELAIEIDARGPVTELGPGHARLADGSQRPFEVAIWTAGLQPSPLPREWGLPTDADGRVRIGLTLEVEGHPGVWVAGDSAAALAPGGVARLSCQAALPMGAHVGDQVARAARGLAPRPFRFGFTLACVSLGRRSGLAQVLHADDSPAATYFSGRWGAFVKEAVCRMTTTVLKLEARGLRVYHWKPATPSAPRELAEAA